MSLSPSHSISVSVCIPIPYIYIQTLTSGPNRLHDIAQNIGAAPVLAHLTHQLTLKVRRSVGDKPGAVVGLDGGLVGLAAEEGDVGVGVVVALLCFLCVCVCV